jgi:hypothetical protein
MPDINKFSEQVIDLAERLADVADAAKGKGIRRGSMRTRWVILPAAGAGLYALATNGSFTRQARGVVDQAKARASDLPEDLLSLVRETSRTTPRRKASTQASPRRKARTSASSRNGTQARRKTRSGR